MKKIAVRIIGWLFLLLFSLVFIFTMFLITYEKEETYIMYNGKNLDEHTISRYRTIIEERGGEVLNIDSSLIRIKHTYYERSKILETGYFRVMVDSIIG